MPRYDLDSLENRNPKLIDRLYRLIHKPLEKYFRSEVRGLERIPPGAGIYVGNHSSGLITPDTFVFGAAVYRHHGVDGMPYGMAHEVYLKLPIFHELLVPVGAVRASPEIASRIFARGNKILVYPGGDLDNMRPYRDRNRIVFGERQGYIRLALRECVPIIPVVSAGAHETFMVLGDLKWLTKALRLDRLLRLKVFPVTLSIPWGLTFGVIPFYFPYPSRILMEILDPIDFERNGPAAAEDEIYVSECAERVESVMQQALSRLARERKGG